MDVKGEALVFIKRWQQFNFQYYLFGLFIFLLLVRVLAILQSQYFITIDRVTYPQNFIFYFLTSESDSIIIFIISIIILLHAGLRKYQSIVTFIAFLLFLVASVITFVVLLDDPLLSILLPIVNATFYLILRHTYKKVEIVRIIEGFIISLLALEFFSIAEWIMNYLLGNEFASGSWKFGMLEAELIQILSNLSPVLFLMLAYSFLFWPVKALLPTNLQLRIQRSIIDQPTNKFIENWSKILLLLMTIAGVMIPLIPYQFDPPHTDQRITVDVVYYVDWLSQLDQSNSLVTDSALGVIFEGKTLSDRPLSLLVMYGFYKATSFPLEDAVKYFTVILSPLSIVAAYFFAFAGSKNKVIAIAAAGFTTISPLMLTGIYAGFFANWFSLILMTIALAFFCVAWDRKSNRYYALCFIFSILAILSYAFIIFFLVGTITIFLIIDSLKNRNSLQSRYIIAPLCLITALVAFDLSFSYAIGISSASMATLDFAAPKFISAQNYVLRWSNLNHSLKILHAGVFGNPMFIILGLIFALASDTKKLLNVMLLSMTFIAGISLIVGDSFYHTRMLFMMPLHIMAASIVASTLLHDKTRSRTKIMIFLLIILSVSTYAIRYLLNLDLEFRS